MNHEKQTIGVATTTTVKERGGTERPVRYYCEMAQHAEHAGWKFAIFDPVEINWRTQRINAWVPTAGDRAFGRWQRQELTLPSVVYENVFVHLNIRGYSRELRRNAHRLGIPLFNPALPNKWRLTQWLQAGELRGFLPSTERLQSSSGALAYLDDWGVAYVKPIGGYGGRGVVQIRSLGRGAYRIAWDRSLHSMERVRKTVNKEQLMRFFEQKLRTPHLVQRGIPLLEVGGRKVDFRVVVQRGSKGQWHSVGVVPKLAARHGVVTNLVAGGERCSLEQLTARAALEGKLVPTADVERAALRIADFITRRCPDAGVLGFDMGLEDNGDIYMIEMNPKPARSLLTASMRRESAKYSTDFARWLASHP